MGCERVDGARQPKQQQPEPACVHSAIAPSGRFRRFARRCARRDAMRRRRHAPKRAWALRSPRGGAASWRGRAPRDRCRVASVSARTTAGASSAYVAWTAVASIRHVTAVALAAEWSDVGGGRRAIRRERTSTTRGVRQTTRQPRGMRPVASIRANLPAGSVAATCGMCRAHLMISDEERSRAPG